MDLAKFKELVTAMRAVERPGEGLAKKAEVVDLLIQSGVFADSDRDTVAGLIEGVVWLAKNRTLLDRLRRARCGCLRRARRGTPTPGVVGAPPLPSE